MPAAYPDRMQPIDPSDLSAGVTWWRTSTRWPADFHNHDYQSLAATNPGGDFTDQWWGPFLRRLTRWLANRPYRASDITALFHQHREELASVWQRTCAPVIGQDITTVSWEQVAPFTDVVEKLKPTRRPSPVFISKFCHFLAPPIFPVTDNLALPEVTRYETYFRKVQDTWNATPVPVQQQLIAQLHLLITQTGSSPHPWFPTVNKIVELALIGRKQSTVSTTN